MVMWGKFISGGGRGSGSVVVLWDGLVEMKCRRLCVFFLEVGVVLLGVGF